MPATPHDPARLAARWLFRCRVAREFPSQQSLEDYLDDHPNAAKEKHWVAEPKGERAPPRKDDGKAPAKGKDRDKPLSLSEAELKRLVPDPGILKFVGEPAKGEEPNAVQHALGKAQKQEPLTGKELDDAREHTDAAKKRPGVTRTDLQKLEELADYWLAMGGLEHGKEEKPGRGRIGLPSSRKREVAQQFGMTPAHVGKVKDFADVLAEKAAERKSKSPREQARKRHDLSAKEADGISQAHDLASRALAGEHRSNMRAYRSEVEDYEAAVGARKAIRKKLREHGFSYSDKTLDEAKATKPKGMSDELHAELSEAPDKPTKPVEPAKAKLSAKALRREIEEGDNEDLAKSIKGVSDEDLLALGDKDAEPTPGEKKKEFLANTDDEELKARVKKMDPDEFEELLAALGEESGGKGRGRRGHTLREGTIRLAFSVDDPALRGRLLRLLEGT